MRTQEWTFNMVTVITTNILWHMTIRTGDRSDHTLVLTRKNKALQVMPWPFRRKPSICWSFWPQWTWASISENQYSVGATGTVFLPVWSILQLSQRSLCHFFCYKFLSSDFSLRMPPIGICCPQPIRPICA